MSIFLLQKKCSSLTASAAIFKSWKALIIKMHHKYMIYTLLIMHSVYASKWSYNMNNILMHQISYPLLSITCHYNGICLFSHPTCIYVGVWTGTSEWVGHEALVTVLLLCFCRFTDSLAFPVAWICSCCVFEIERVRQSWLTFYKYLQYERGQQRSSQ